MPNQNPKASLIITTRNRPQLLTRAVQSAWASSNNVEVVVVDDASSDETADVCRGLAGINYVRLEQNRGVAGARNAGINLSRGEFLSFLDDDDVRLPDSLDAQVEALEHAPQAGLVYGQAILGDQSGQPTDQIYPRVCAQGDVFWNLLEQNFIPCGSVVFRRSCLNRVGMLDDSLPGIDDWDLWLRIAEVFPVIALEKPMMIWRRSNPASGQGTSSAADLVSQSVRQFRRSWLALPRAANASHEMRREAWRGFSVNIAEHLVWETMRAVQYGKVKDAIRNIFTLLRLCPAATMRLASTRNLARARRMITRQARAITPSYSESINRPALHKDRA